MTVVYLTDIHDNFAGVSSVLNQTSADLYILSGDLTYHAFGSDENLFRFIELQEKIKALSEKGISPSKTLHLAEDLKGGLKVDLLSAAESKEYRELAAEAHLELRRKYETLNKAVVATQKTCFIIPGNYDISLDGTAVAKYSLHQKTAEFDGLKFAGYGSAPVFTPGIPEELAVPFEEAGSGAKMISKPRDFLTEAKADIFVLHNPAYGTLDKLPRYGHCGSHGLREAIDEVAPRLVLSGHVHESYGLLKLGTTFFLNPSNFGAVEAMEGKQPGGYFATFQLQVDGDGQKYLREVTWKRLVSGNIREICNIKIDKKNRATETVNDADEYAAMGKFLL
ncbi:metallophosphoesterase family protein [Turneriella parva]|uniref:Metallophosphoesterase n=1 Tax=Turneriella parva (strain ATCC BAA-1111 / DSM 21527 / NCTC 11395 / H) TaxID=869212 RepID=I4B1X2_TURPD|nr:metallophosphoesterase [Turneriella parva]AFM11279.1 metallophosphoesterase [Turneriella parva DSM 21527]